MSDQRCPTCDFIGPEESDAIASRREVHRVLHEAVRPYVSLFRRVFDVLAQEDTQADYTLAGPSKGDGGGSK